MRNAFESSAHDSLLRTCTRRAFTVIELLIVCVIIAVLIAILIPTISYVKTSAKKAATAAVLRSIGTGLDAYHAEFKMYVPSQATLPPGYAGVIYNRGSEMLAQGLTGYLNGDRDGAGNPAHDPTSTAAFAGDPAYGFRTRTGGRGTVYGPYSPPGGENWKIIEPTHQVYIDTWGNEIIYYRAVPSIMNNQQRSVTMVFAPWNDIAVPPNADFRGVFVTNDNSATQETNDAGTHAIPDPAAASANFFKLLGVNGNTLSGPVLGRDRYLLVSAGPDRTYFTADDIVQGGN